MGTYSSDRVGKEVVGSVKEAIGTMTGDAKLEVEGMEAERPTFHGLRDEAPVTPSMSSDPMMADGSAEVLAVHAERVSIGKLEALVGLAETTHCRRTRLLGYFGETPAGAGCRDARLRRGDCVTPG